MQKQRRFPIDKPVLYFRLILPSVRRVFVDSAAILYRALRDVEEVEFALARSAVVAGNYANKFIRITRNLAAIEKRVRPVARRSVE